MKTICLEETREHTEYKINEPEIKIKKKKRNKVGKG
jgi:hypothetical protein